MRERHYALFSIHCHFHLFKDLLPLPAMGHPLCELSDILTPRCLKAQVISSDVSSLLQRTHHYETSLMSPAEWELTNIPPLWARPMSGKLYLCLEPPSSGSCPWPQKSLCRKAGSVLKQQSIEADQ